MQPTMSAASPTRAPGHGGSARSDGELPTTKEDTSKGSVASCSFKYDFKAVSQNNGGIIRRGCVKHYPSR